MLPAISEKRGIKESQLYMFRLMQLPRAGMSRQATLSHRELSELSQPFLAAKKILRD